MASLHIIKLCVGIGTLDELRAEFAARLERQGRRGEPAEIAHTTRMVPQRRDALAGGSLYWVIRGQIQARQRLLDIRPFVDAEGIGRCRLVLEPVIVPTEWQPRRAFQGWRYLEAKDVPGDLKDSATAELPAKLRAELAELGLL